MDPLVPAGRAYEKFCFVQPIIIGCTVDPMLEMKRENPGSQ